MRTYVAVVLLSLMTAACTGGEPPVEDADSDATAAAEGVAPPPANQVGQVLPDTTAEGVWAFLQEAAYDDNWELWPGQGEFYDGGDPHGMLLTTYLNPTAAEALAAGVEAMPVGAVLVKENYRPDSALVATTVMVKQVEGYNPDHNDWWFLKHNADGSVDAAGRATGCQNCHGDAADNDYIFTGPLGG